MENNNNINNNKREEIVRERRQKRNLTKQLVVMALFVAINIILGDVIAPIKTATMKFGFGFIGLILCGMYLGPVRGAIVGFVTDILGYASGFVVGAFFPGFTLNAIVGQMLAGYFLEGKKASKMTNVVIWAILSTVLIDMIMTTTWLVIMYSKGDFAKFIPRLLPRLANQGVITALKIILTPILYQGVFKRLRLEGVENPGIR